MVSLNKSSLVLGVVLLFCVIAVSIWFVTLNDKPKPIDIEAVRKRNSKKCADLLCISEWFGQEGVESKDFGELFEKCSRKRSNQLRKVNQTYPLYEKGELDISYFVKYYSYNLYNGCHRECGVSGPFRMYSVQHDYWLMIYKLRANEMEFVCKNYPVGKSCQFHGMANLFQHYFGYISIPVALFLNIADLSIMRQALKTVAGPAMYFHFAEITTDAFFNIILSFRASLHVFTYVDMWAKSCGFYMHVFKFRHCVPVLERYISFLNQLFLTGIILDRLFALAKPMVYNGIGDQNLRERGKKLSLLIFPLGSLLFFFFFIVFGTFNPIFNYWRKGYTFWKTHFVTIDNAFRTFYATATFALVVIQIVGAIWVERKYRQFMNRRIDADNREQVKKQERDKQMLLVGTIGLNIFTMLVTTFFYLTSRSGFFRLLGIPFKEVRHYQKAWYRALFKIANHILIFFNGNGGLIFHVILVKSYRAAFKNTPLGKLLYRQKVNSSKVQSFTTSSTGPGKTSRADVVEPKGIHLEA